MNTKSELNTYDLDDIDNIIQNPKRNIRRFKYTLSDAILFLLFADKNNPVRGKIRQMKEVFLMLQEVFREDNSIQPVDFEKKRFGPYSEMVEYTINELILSNYLSTRGKKNTKDFAIEITPFGIEYIRERYKSLPLGLQETLRRKREEWDTLTPSGLMKLIYTHYDEYLENSVLKNRFEKIDWSNEKQGSVKS